MRAAIPLGLGNIRKWKRNIAVFFTAELTFRCKDTFFNPNAIPFFLLMFAGYRVMMMLYYEKYLPSGRRTIYMFIFVIVSIAFGSIVGRVCARMACRRLKDGQKHDEVGFLTME
ncbi:MAG: hypothetical protein ACI4TW_00650 [Prevotella sp.]